MLILAVWSQGAAEEEVGGEEASWADLPGDAALKQRLYQLIVEPIERPERLARLNVRPITGSFRPQTLVPEGLIH